MDHERPAATWQGRPVTGASIALVLVAAVIHASWNLLAKRARDPFTFLWLATALAMTWLVPLAAFFAPATVLEVLPAAGISALVHGLYFGTLGEAYRAGDLSRVYPIARGLGVALAPVLALGATGVVPAPLAAAGIALVVIAIRTSARLAECPDESGAAADGRARSGASRTAIASLATRGGARPSRRGTILAVTTGVLIATYSVVDHGGVAHASPIPYLAATNAGALVVSAPFVWRRRDAAREALRHERGPLAGAACLSVTGYLLILYAFRSSPASYVVAMRETSIVVATLLGRFVLHEPVSPRRAAAALGIVACAAAIALA